MANEKFLVEYQETIAFYKDTNRLLELNDKYISILQNLPDPKEADTFSLESDDDRAQSNYNLFYFTRRRLQRKVDSLYEKYSFVLTKAPGYEGYDETLNDMADRLGKVSGVKDINNIVPLRNVLLLEAIRWSKSLSSMKDQIDDDRRKLVNANASGQKNDATTDSQQVSAQRNAAGTRLSDSAMRSVSQSSTIAQIAEDRLREVTEKKRGFSRLNEALGNLTDRNTVSGWAKRFDNIPKPIKAILGGGIEVTGLTSSDLLLGKFTIQNLILRRQIRKSGALTTETDKLDAYLRKKIRKKYGKNVPFCDEDVITDGRSVRFVKKKDSEATLAILDAQGKLMDDVIARIPDDH